MTEAERGIAETLASVLGPAARTCMRRMIRRVEEAEAKATFYKARQETTRAMFDGTSDEIKASMEAEDRALGEWRRLDLSDAEATYCVICQRHCPFKTWGEAREAGWETTTSGLGPDGMTTTCSDACRRGSHLWEPENVEY